MVPVPARRQVTTVSFTIHVSSATRLALWDGKRWRPGAASVSHGTSAGVATDPAAGEIDGAVRALAVGGAELFAGGEITRAGRTPVSRIARWDGRAWSALGSGVNGTVRAIAVVGKDVYAGGDFTEAGGAPAHGIARWDGRRWSPLGDGVTGCREDSALPPSTRS